MPFIDLTHIISLSSTPRTIYPGDPELKIAPHATIPNDGYSVHVLSLGTHTGTHIDAPAHFIEGGRTVDEIPLSQLVGKALVVDFTVGDIGLPAARKKLEWADLENAWLLSTSGSNSLGEKMDSGEYSMLLVNTGWSKSHYPATHRSETRSDSNFFHHPYCSSSVADRLLSSKVYLFGCDTPNPDETPYDGIGGAEGYVFHEVLLGGGGLIVENLANLEQLGHEDDWIVTISPLKIEGVDGSPVRAFACKGGDV